METRKRSKRLLRMIERIKRMKISLIHGGNHYPTLTVFALFYLQVFRLQEVQVPPVSFERVSMGLTDSRKTAKNLADSRKT